ncbi:hypothetical protein P168DRAFT_293482 [Aspergillus campestris IBT 28561]|uniref:Uncharacterized protein n=1 Tax=Aspergillus campestris (strain IBT 28561) TaxID=1392248 RepID=A0A2I1CSP1_ASPC2|nr:uncharacterized protein P168DRAFT_293482 [Aspergillus campestris IBT 28561]PKY00639.1 hypothetical protein P168DRAFT_293482 [Aspergillus campestris IBT 28561]
MATTRGVGGRRQEENFSEANKKRKRKEKEQGISQRPCKRGSSSEARRESRGGETKWL